MKRNQLKQIEVKKAFAGHYHVFTSVDRYFEITRIDVYSEGEVKCYHWHLFESTGELHEYWNTFTTKRAAVNAIKNVLFPNNA